MRDKDGDVCFTVDVYRLYNVLRASYCRKIWYVYSSCVPVIYTFTSRGEFDKNIGTKTQSYQQMVYVWKYF